LNLELNLEFYVISSAFLWTSLHISCATSSDLHLSTAEVAKSWCCSMLFGGFPPRRVLLFVFINLHFLLCAV